MWVRQLYIESVRLSLLILILYKNKKRNTFKVRFKNSKTISFASSIMKKVVMFPSRSKFFLTYNILRNTQLHNSHLDQLQFFKCYIFFNQFLLQRDSNPQPVSLQMKTQRFHSEARTWRDKNIQSLFTDWSKILHPSTIILNYFISTVGRKYSLWLSQSFFFFQW